MSDSIRLQNIADQTRLLKEFIYEQGFSLCGIAAALPLEEEFEHYVAWLQAGKAGDLTYMYRNLEKRLDIRNIVPNAQTVVVVGLNYYSSEQPEAAEGKIARYARGDDYHNVMPKKLRKIGEKITSLQTGADWKIYADTGPVLEKQWAVRAGLGWQGKHTNIISRGMGSWFFIGVIITTAKFLTDAPIGDFCGSCTACIEACPTQALEPYSLDATKCISYWNIEKARDSIPQEIAVNMENWLFGCDICQEVCPWNNRFSKETQETRFLPRQGTGLHPEFVLAADEKQWQPLLQGSPLKRAKPEGLRQTAQILINNSNQ